MEIDMAHMDDDGMAVTLLADRARVRTWARSLRALVEVAGDSLDEYQGPGHHEAAMDLIAQLDGVTP